MKSFLSRHKAFILGVLSVVGNVAAAVWCSFFGASLAVFYFYYYGF